MKKNTIKSITSGLMLLIMATLWPGVANAWWNEEFSFRKEIKLDTSKTGADINSELKDVPVLIRLHPGNFTYFFDLKPDASDLRFIAGDDKTPLKFHIEKFDPINQMAFIWVTLPKITAASTTEQLWMYYGNPKAIPISDSAGSYDATMSGIYHFANSIGLPQDSTGNARYFKSSTAERAPASLIGAGLTFNGSTQSVIEDYPGLQFNPLQGFSFSAWVRLAGEQNNSIIFSRQNDIAKSELQIIADKNTLYARVKTTAGEFSTAPINVSSGAWHQLGLSLSNKRLTLYLDGKETAAVDVLVSQLSGDILLGSLADNTRYYVGDMDEVQLSAIARSADYFNAAFQNQGLDARLVSYGGDESNQSDSGGTSYFLVIMQNVTEDGWAVIIMCVILGIVSWVVMLGKSMLLRRVRKDNKAFIIDFGQLGAQDPSKLDHEDDELEREFTKSPVSQALFGKHDHYQSSNIYHVYHRGMQEVNARLGKSLSAAATKTLSSRSLDAIRAGLDAAVVRETQKLNAQMVILTIAISGGPFLGLLGTVVGVMITFAAIALAGDVNVNAIAPGIAAALLATVAGLLVAIPALFGYNYLGSKINEAIADMHVFVDEFVTRIGEHYGD